MVSTDDVVLFFCVHVVVVVYVGNFAVVVFDVAVFICLFVLVIY